MSKPTGIFPYHKKWKSEIKVNRKTVYLGLHDTEQLAIKAQVDYRKENGIAPPKKKCNHCNGTGKI